jgi:hypothetical protein
MMISQFIAGLLTRHMEESMLIFEDGGRMILFKKETVYRICRDTLSDLEKKQ